MSCIFCAIVAGEEQAHVVLETDDVVAFLDTRPVFKGHVLVVPREHVVTLPELPTTAIEPFFAAVQRVAAALPDALGAQGTLVAMNNIVSQSVPHLHAHVVPRTKGDGLRGFFWPRHKYADGEAAEYAKRVAAALGPSDSWRYIKSAPGNDTCCVTVGQARSMTTNTEPSSRTPLDWPPIADEVLAGALEQAFLALSDDGPSPVGERLARYYDVAGNYVGATFTSLQPNEQDGVTSADLHATTLMNVKLGPRATRQLLTGPMHDGVVAAMISLPDVTLADADDAALEAMYAFYIAVKEAISSPLAAKSNPWVTTSKLCARKRPHLFPVRDRDVCTLLGVRALKDVRADWQVFRALMQNPQIREAIAALPEAARAAAQERELLLDDSDLRLLDAALWTYTKRGTPEEPPVEEE
ncbi:DUF6308 family protein [Georgenia faecalis]|uniref:DUF6308 family protein n=1 Tax=Georgenia faecalis TaxID=2483799 RepID=A0ABV9DCG6_9MICO|nr:DUF6308 family protein [Georgenia faecalis]